jgi:signal peptidase I
MATVPLDPTSGSARRRPLPVPGSKGTSPGLPISLRALRRASYWAVVIIAAVWSGALPQQLGGDMSYVITSGISMLPRYHAGDLVIVRREPSYHVGEVAAFHNQHLHVVVLHRIVAIDGSHYVFKGDNNSYVTTYEPTKAQIIGAKWLHLAGAGRILLDLRTPVVAAVLLGLLWLYSFWRPSTTRRRRRRHRHAG